jgi:hypothetical protein
MQNDVGLLDLHLAVIALPAASGCLYVLMSPEPEPIVAIGAVAAA